jgi:hypothetical protein
VAKYLISHFPLQNHLLKDLQILSPEEKRSNDSALAIKRIAMALPQAISQTEMNSLLDERKLYIFDEAQNQSNQPQVHEGRIDKYWAGVLEKKTLTGEQKYKVLPKVVKSALTLAHGNADCERSLSANKRTLTPERTAMGEMTLLGIRAIKDAVRRAGGPHKVMINSEMRKAAQSAHSVYKKRMVALKEQEEKAKQKEDRENQIEQERMENLKKEKIELKADTKELAKEERKHQETLKEASEMIESANSQLSEALKKKNFLEVSIAQAILESANKKMKIAREEIQSTRKKRNLLDCRKRKALDTLTPTDKRIRGIQEPDFSS